MYYIVNKNKGLYGVKDSKDNIIDYCSLHTLQKIIDRGIEIKGITTKDGVISYIEKYELEDDTETFIAKNKFLGHVVIFDARYSYRACRFELSKLPKGSRVAVINNSNITCMDSLFRGFEFETLDLSHFDTSKITDFDSMFREFKTKHLDLSNFDTTRATSMQNMFCGADIKTINMTSFDTSYVYTMYGMFSDCKTDLIDLRNFNISELKEASFMFHGCKAATIDLSGLKLEKFTARTWMFDNCISDIIVDDENIIDYLERQNLAYLIKR